MSAILSGAHFDQLHGTPHFTMRMSMRWFTRLTNAFSKKIDNHGHALSLYFVFYNFMRPHKALAKATPAVAAGLTTRSLGWNSLRR